MLPETLDSSTIIQIHVAAATLGLALGPLVLWQRGPGRLHKALGRVWVAAMAVVAISSFGIAGFAMVGPFGPIHLLSVWVLWSLAAGIAHARAGRIAAHRGLFHDLYWYGLGIAGAFTLVPGRSMNAALFSDAPWLGTLAVVVILTGLGAKWGLGRRRAARRRRQSEVSSRTGRPSCP